MNISDMSQDNGVKFIIYRKSLKERRNLLMSDLIRDDNEARREEIRNNLHRLEIINDLYHEVKFKIIYKEEMNLSSENIEGEMTNFFEAVDGIFTHIQSTETMAERNQVAEVPTIKDKGFSSTKVSDSSEEILNILDPPSFERQSIEKVKENRHEKYHSLIIRKELDLIEEHRNPCNDISRIQIPYDLGRIKMAMDLYEYVTEKLDKEFEMMQQPSSCPYPTDDLLHVINDLNRMKISDQTQQDINERSVELDDRQFQINRQYIRDSMSNEGFVNRRSFHRPNNVRSNYFKRFGPQVRESGNKKYAKKLNKPEFTQQSMNGKKGNEKKSDYGKCPQNKQICYICKKPGHLSYTCSYKESKN